ncbi:MAG: hypothetical protein U0805_12760 [Pirellulales bacterium]
MNCFEHPSKPAVGTCTNCGRGLCKECTTVVEGKLSCRGTCQAEVARVRQLMLKNERAADERSVVYGTTAKSYHQSFASAAFFGLIFLIFGAILIYTDAIFPGTILLGLGVMLGIRSIGLSRAARKYKALAASNTPEVATSA